MKIKRIIHGIGANIYDKFVISGVQLALVPILVNHWGLDTYGVWVLLATIPSFLSVSDFGFGTAAGTQMIMVAAQGKHKEAVSVFQSACLMVLACTSLTLVAALTCVWLVPDPWLASSAQFGGQDVRVTLTFLIVYAVVALQASLLTSAFRAAGFYPLAAFWNANTILFENGGAIVAVLLGGTPVQVAQTLLACRLLAVIGQALLLRRMVPWLSLGFGLSSWELMRALTKPALAALALPLGQASFLQGTALALGAAAGPAAVPAFTAVRTISRIGMQITQLVVNAIMPEFSGSMARGERDAVSAMMLATLLCSAMVVLPFAAVLGVFGTDIVALWTHGAIHAPASLVYAMAASVVLGGFWNPIATLIVAINRQGSYALFFVGVALLTIPISYGLSLYLAATGSALAIIFLDLMMCLMIGHQARVLFRGKVELRTAAGIIADRARRLFSKATR